MVREIIFVTDLIRHTSADGSTLSLSEMTLPIISALLPTILDEQTWVHASRLRDLTDWPKVFLVTPTQDPCRYLRHSLDDIPEVLMLVCIASHFDCNMRLRSTILLVSLSVLMV